MLFAFSGLLLLAQTPTNALPALAPPYGEIPPTFWERHGTVILVAGIALIALAVLILWKLFQPKPPVILPPEVLAREALSKLLDQPEDGRLLSNVSQILRRYVIAAFELPAAELTTTEFCAALAASEKIDRNWLRPFLVFCESVTSGNFHPPVRPHRSTPQPARWNSSRSPKTPDTGRVLVQRKNERRI